MLPENDKSNAPNDEFYVIMELTREEKQELLKMWQEKSGH